MSDTKCIKCGQLVGNTVFTMCDNCWDKNPMTTPTPKQRLIEAGQKLYRLLGVKNNEITIEEVTVLSVGKKYFYIDDRKKFPISLDTLSYIDDNYCQRNFQLFKTKKEIETILKRNELETNIKTYFSNYNYSKKQHTLQELEQIAKIIGILE
jgi:uncharacterized protein YxjI